MKDKEEMISLGGGRFISKLDYQNAVEKYYKTHKISDFVPLTFEGKVIGRVCDIKRMTIEITTDEGKKIIDGILHQPIGISSRKMGSISDNGTVDDSQPYTEFSIFKNLSDNPNIEEQN